MMKFNDEHMRKMSEEDKHTIKDYESVRTLVWKLELQMVVLKERRDSGGFNPGVPSGVGHGGSSSISVPIRLELKGGEDRSVVGWTAIGMDEVMPMRCLGPSPCRDHYAKGVGR